jgi:hypothetical protein
VHEMKELNKTRISAVCVLIVAIFLVFTAIPISAAQTQSANLPEVVLKNPIVAGYTVASSNGSVTAVFVSFTIPRIFCNASSPSSQSVEIIGGIDGFSTYDFEYVGVEEVCQQGPNSPDYFAVSSGYYSSIQGIVPVKAGDVISASIIVSGAKFHYSFDDLTTGRSATDSSSTAGTGLDAADCWAGGSPPVSQFDPISFGASSTHVSNTCDARINGSTLAFGKFRSEDTVYKLVEVGSTNIIASPSPLSDEGSSFSVMWENAS